jgi:hypothetical protein
MVTVTSKSSKQIQFPGGLRRVGPLEETLTVTVETGVVIFQLSGTNAHDWTRDTVTFPVGQNTSGFVSGIASASATSFWTPLKNVSGSNDGSETIFVQGSTGSGDSVSASGQVSFPGSLIPPPIGVAIDSSTITHSGAAQPQLTLALAVFGDNTDMLRAEYTAFIVTAQSNIVAGGGTTTTVETR